MAVPTFVSIGTIATDVSGGASTTPTPPTHVADDILIAVAGNQANAGMTTATSGWTAINNQAAVNFATAMWWKRATAAGTAGPTITAASTDQFAYVFVIRGCIATGTPFEAAERHGFLSNAPATLNLTTLGASRLVTSVLFNDTAATFSSGYPPAGYTSNVNLTDATGTASHIAVMSITQATAGTVTAVSWGTLSASVNGGSHSLAFIPPPDASNRVYSVTQAIHRASYY